MRKLPKSTRESVAAATFERSYLALIRRAQERGWSVNRSRKTKSAGYYEVHHIIPRRLGGSDERSNLVGLTPTEHFFAHWYLANIHGGAMWAALLALCGDTAITKRQLNRRAIPGFARRYAIARSRHAESIQGDQHPNWKGGRPFCIDCGKQVQLHAAVRCKRCNAAFQRGANHPNFRSGLPQCKSCGREMAGYSRARKLCRSCYEASITKGKQKCVACGKLLNTYNRSVERCRACYATHNTGRNNPNYGKAMSAAQKHKLSKAMRGRPAWRNGRATSDTRRVFAEAASLYDLWRSLRPGGYRLATLAGDRPSRAHHTIVEYFRDGWVPTSDADWTAWKKSRA